MVYETEWAEGSLPSIHMGLLAASPERVLALRLALSSVLTRSSLVLDAGCGSLGVLAIMAATLGARHVTAVDLGNLDTARALARENGVADRITFIEGDLSELDALAGTFDVIVGMIYNNDVWLDLGQQQVMAALAGRVAQPGAAFIPDTVRYTAVGYDSAPADGAARTRDVEWDEAIARVAACTGISLAAAVDAGPRSWPRRPGVAGALTPTELSARDGAGWQSARRLTGRARFADISYRRPWTATRYPARLDLVATDQGRLDMTVWRQDLLFGDLLIRGTERRYDVAPARPVAAGDTVTLATEAPWPDGVITLARR